MAEPYSYKIRGLYDDGPAVVVGGVEASDQPGIPLLNIPSIDNMFQLKIMTVHEIIEMHNRAVKHKRSYNENLATTVVAGLWGHNNWMDVEGLSY